MRELPLGLLLILVFAHARAQPVQGAYFSFADWEVACDNTRTCRMAGYHEGVEGPEVSVLLTRKGGPGAAVSGQLRIGGDPDAKQRPPAGARLQMRIDGKPLGTVNYPRDDNASDLSPEQVTALVAALARTTTIEWVLGNQRWRLSDKGAAAVMLKMDDVQGRVGTQGALLRKGAASEDKVPSALPAPVLDIPALPKAPADGERLPADAEKSLRPALRAALKDKTDCELMQEHPPQPIAIHRLTGGKALATTPCWRAAYNAGSAYWVINAVPPWAPVLVTMTGTEYSDGVISAAHKGRGIGDCWSFESWAWDGKRFVSAELSTTGACKGIAAGGAWNMPTRVTELRKVNR
jgi:hypothetical protein